MLFMNKHHKVSFSYYFIFNKIMWVLDTFRKEDTLWCLSEKACISLTSISRHICSLDAHAIITYWQSKYHTLCLFWSAHNVIIIIIFLSDPLFYVTFLNLRHNSFQTKEKTRADQNGGKFECFSKLKIAFYLNRSLFVEVHWVIYRIRWGLNEKKTKTKIDVMSTFNKVYYQKSDYNVSAL